MLESESDDDAPDQVSFTKAKSDAQEEQRLIKLKKANDIRMLKLKRRLKEENYISQKKEKIAKLREKESLFSSNLLDQLRVESIQRNPIPSVTDNDTSKTIPSKTLKTKKKFYPNHKIEVVTLSDVKSERAAAAANFREKRLAKVHREPATVNIAHAEKLAASGKL